VGRLGQAGQLRRPLFEPLRVGDADGFLAETMCVQVLFDGLDERRRLLDEGMCFLQEGVEVRVDRFEEEGSDRRKRGSRNFGTAVASQAYLPVEVDAVSIPVYLLVCKRYSILQPMTTRDEKRFETLKASLADLGPFRRGTVLRRFVKCARASCHCRADPPQLHGPYYEWTRKVKGKTVSVRVTEEQARLLRQWIADARRLDEIIAEMQSVSDRLTEPLFQAVGKSPRGS